MNKRFEEDFRNYCNKQSDYGLTQYQVRGTSYSTNNNYGCNNSNVTIATMSEKSMYRKCGGSPVDFNDRVNINFYEWSSMDKGIRGYESLKAFVDFLDESNINYSDIHLGMLKEKGKVWFCSCIPNHPILIVRNTYRELSEALELFRSHADVFKMTEV